MPLTPIQIQKRGSSGGGGLGSVIGGTLGAAAGFLGGGPAGAAAGYSVGSSLGGVAGSKIDPAKAGGSVQLTPLQHASAAPDESHSQILEQSLAALNEVPQHIAEAYAEPLTKAYELSKRRGGYA